MVRLVALTALVLAASARPAFGQLCHAPALPAAHAGHAAHAGPRPHAQAAVAVEAQRLPGSADVQGVTPSLHAGYGRFALRVAVPTYRLARDGAATAVGLGDVTVETSAELLTAAAWRAGVSLGAGVPTGARDDGLGMGHTMLMPALWASAQPGRVRLAGSLSLGASVESDDGGGHDHHHGHTVPVVNPMNRREVGGSLRAGYAPIQPLEVYALALGAAPIGDGVTRTAVGIGARWQLGAWSVGGEADAGVVGRPFIARGVLDLTRHF
jgi:hypothetical protein